MTTEYTKALVLIVGLDAVLSSKVGVDEQSRLLGFEIHSWSDQGDGIGVGTRLEFCG